MPDLLFVYGSLRSEFDNAHARRLRNESEFAGPATAPGSIFLLGPYPGYRSSPDGIVHGEVYRLREPAKTLANLDEYEGAEYQRILIHLVSPEGEAWIYQYSSDPLHAPRILSGDFTQQ